MIKFLNYTIMKKLYYFLLLLPLWGSGGFSCAQSVKLIGSHFDTGAVTFTVDVGAATPTWVLVEYTTDPSPTSAIMSRATFTEASYTPSLAGTLAAEGRGFLLTSSATITAKLSGVNGRFSWCGYAFGAPPNAKLKPDGSYTLHGTPPFIVNGDTLAAGVRTFGPGTCIESITDFTYNPAWSAPTPFSAGSITTAGTATIVGIAPAAIVANAAPASGGDRNITYQWRRSDGTGSATLTGSSATYALNEDPENYSTAGTYYFTRYAKDGCNTTFTPSGGQYTLRVVPDAALPPYSGTLTWTVGTQIWSGALSNPVTGCTSATVFGPTNPPTVAYYRSEELYDDSGYLYNWKCSNEQRSNLCPSPWRLPKQSDFVALDIALGGNGGQRVVSSDWLNATYVGLWGARFGKTLSAYESNVFIYNKFSYWADQLQGGSAGNAYLRLSEDNDLCPICSSYWNVGCQLRCVR
jgi:uncharacterized protein (TIGR02145 family)